jgi:hypothetical protein
MSLAVRMYLGCFEQAKPAQNTPNDRQVRNSYNRYMIAGTDDQKEAVHPIINF